MFFDLCWKPDLLHSSLFYIYEVLLIDSCTLYTTSQVCTSPGWLELGSWELGMVMILRACQDAPPHDGKKSLSFGIVAALEVHFNLLCAMS